MQKIIEIIYNVKSYTPSEIEKIIDISISQKSYTPTEIEKLIDNVFGFILTEDDSFLRCENGDFLIQ